MVINVLAVLTPALFLVHLKKSICISNLFNKQDMNKTMEKKQALRRISSFSVCSILRKYNVKLWKADLK